MDVRLFIAASAARLLNSIGSGCRMPMMRAKVDGDTGPVNLGLCKKSQGEHAALLQIVR